MNARKVAGVLLAAGTSSRMGKNKLFLDIDGETVLRRAARAGRSAGLHPLVVVLGHESDRAGGQLAGLDCAAVVNPRYAEGMNTSVSAGISALGEGPDAAVVMLADMPFVTAEMIAAVVSTWHNEPLVLSLYGDVVAPPVLYARPLFRELRALEGEEGGKRVVEAHRAAAAEVRWPASALQDLDVPADVDRVRLRLET
jgi:molybdenum cofactor cytidylyltransferase